MKLEIKVSIVLLGKPETRYHRVKGGCLMSFESVGMLGLPKACLAYVGSSQMSALELIQKSLTLSEEKK